MKIIIETIPHKQQRYPTVGDWYFEEECVVTTGPTRRKDAKKVKVLHIRVSAMKDWRHEYLVALHELVEVMQCRHDGVTQAQVDRFDIAFEKRRKPGNVDEPGDSRNAPYQKQHALASGIERVAMAALDVKLDDYAEEVEKL
jgi:hypothetical protein